MNVAPKSSFTKKVALLDNFALTSRNVAHCISTAKTMQKFAHSDDLPHLMRHKYVADEFKSDRIAEYAKAMAEPKNTLCFLTSKKFEDSTLPLHEKWYNIDYSSEKYSEQLLASMLKPECRDNGKLLDLPPKNTLLPKSFEIMDSDSSLSSKPALIQQWDESEMWYKKDDQFKKPKAFVSMKIYSNDCYFSESAKGKVFGDLWSSCLQESLREFAY
jgi:nardilysin